VRSINHVSNIYKKILLLIVQILGGTNFFFLHWASFAFGHCKGEVLVTPPECSRIGQRPSSRTTPLPLWWRYLRGRLRRFASLRKQPSRAEATSPWSEPEPVRYGARSPSVLFTSLCRRLLETEPEPRHTPHSSPVGCQPSARSGRYSLASHFDSRVSTFRLVQVFSRVGSACFVTGIYLQCFSTSWCILFARWGSSFKE